ncbi:MAG: bifunctional phosphoribosylaminoimidazolecarboxamide formyltransferase/IMP cyclohydrolase [Candidatus Krumholzibacteriia bacterium]
MASVPVSGERRALLSVTDKTGLVELATALRRHGYRLIASGGTAGHLREAGFEVTGVGELTGYPEIFGGRVKTLHPAIHGGILGPTTEAFAATAELGIAPIDLVAVNLYRFEDALLRGAGEAETVEQIDVGGPAMLRAAAKNHRRVTVVADPSRYAELMAELDNNDGATTPSFRQRMAALAFRRCEQYDDAVAGWLEGLSDERAGLVLRYGENPHQAAVLRVPGDDLAAVGLVQHGGKELSYNNLVDLVAALKLVADFAAPCCGVIKHTNPCGFGLGTGAVGLERALMCDPVSAFGGVFAFNAAIDEATAEILAGRFLEIIAAPAYAEGALARLTRKKNVRVLTVDLERFARTTAGRSRAWGSLRLWQDEDAGFPELEDWDVVAGDDPDEATRAALELAWKVAKHGKSNAIVLAGGGATLGCGFGQMSRVDSVELAILKAGNQGLDLQGAVAASDGFFPFPDGVQKLAAAGVRAVVAPGGSIRDDEVAAAARDLGITLILTGRRHFNH